MIRKIFTLALSMCLTITAFSQNNGLEKINYQKSLQSNLGLVKAIESQMKLIPQSSYITVDKTFSAGDFYISIFETSNELYHAFLNDLKSNGLNDLAEKCKVDVSAWTKLSEAYGTASKYYDSDPKYSEFPVVNITKEDAELFCVWLTRLYAVYDQAKYPGAEFRLPNEAEWMVAASAGVTNAIYPWDGKFLTNKKGEYNANFKVAGEENIHLNPETGNIEVLENNVLYQTTLQPVRTYTPNAYGLYQMSGNAAELTLDGAIKGGSWHSYGHYMQLAAEPEYGMDKLPNPFTGFRIVLKAK